VGAAYAVGHTNRIGRAHRSVIGAGASAIFCIDEVNAEVISPANIASMRRLQYLGRYTRSACSCPPLAHDPFLTPSTAILDLDGVLTGRADGAVWKY
jgi:hypothetical protein